MHFRRTRKYGFIYIYRDNTRFLGTNAVSYIIYSKFTSAFSFNRNLHVAEMKLSARDVPHFLDATIQYHRI